MPEPTEREWLEGLRYEDKFPEPGFSAAWQDVTCADCGRQYRCTPSSDYYHRPDVPDDERTTENGVCELCLLGGRRLIDPDASRREQNS